jgi:hypothetical protein
MGRIVSRWIAVLALGMTASVAAWAIPTPKLMVTSQDGHPVIYRLNDGSYLGLWNFAFSDNAGPVTLDSQANLAAGFSGGSILGFYAPDFSGFAFPQTFARGMYEGAMWVRWIPQMQGPLVYSWEYMNRGGVTKQGSVEMLAQATEAGDPFASSLPEPRAIALLALGILMLTAAGLRQRRPAFHVHGEAI